jgi:hypothetical protein
VKLHALEFAIGAGIRKLNLVEQPDRIGMSHVSSRRPSLSSSGCPTSAWDHGRLPAVIPPNTPFHLYDGNTGYLLAKELPVASSSFRGKTLVPWFVGPRASTVKVRRNVLGLTLLHAT